MDKIYTRDEKSYRIVTNSRGLRGKEYSYEKSQGSYRVLALGDSMIFGAGGVENGELLTELLEMNDQRLEVLNFGVPGYCTDQEFGYLKRNGRRYQPDVIILFVFVNDFACAYKGYETNIRRPKGYVRLIGGQLEFVPPELSLLYRLTGLSTIAAIADHALRLAGWGQYAIDPPVSVNLSEQYEIFRQLLANLDRSSHNAGADFAVVYVPDREARRTGAYQDLLRQFSLQAGIQYLDLTGTLNADPTRYFNRDPHINASGHRFVADVVWNQMVGPRLRRARSLSPKEER